MRERDQEPLLSHLKHVARLEHDLGRRFGELAVDLYAVRACDFERSLLVRGKEANGQLRVGSQEPIKRTVDMSGDECRVA